MHLGLTLAQQGMSDKAQAHFTNAHRLYQRLALAMPHDQRYQSALTQLEAMVATSQLDDQKT
jgi:hypothetical protein